MPAAWAAAEFPAEEYALILWNHGGGSVRGICFDQNYGNDSLTLPELETALSSAVQSTGQKFSFIGFDACLMATLDIALIAARFSENMIASQELEPAAGWDYELLVERLGTEGFYESVLDGYAAKCAGKEYYTLSHIDLTAFDAVADGFAELVERLAADQRPRTVIDALNAGAAFGSSNGEGSAYDLYDLGNLFGAYGLEWPSDCVSVVAGDLHKDATGLSVYFPLKGGGGFDAYSAVAELDAYERYLQAFYSEREQQTVAFEQYLTFSDSALQFTVTSSSVNYLQTVEYTLYREEDGKRQVLGSDAVVDSATSSSVRFMPQFVWGIAEGEAAYCEVAAAFSDCLLYSMPVTVNFFWAELWFAYFPESGQTLILGITYDGDDTGLHDLQEGDEVHAMHREIGEDGIVRDEFESEFVVYGADFRLNRVPLAAGQYTCTATVYDLYNKTFDAGDASFTVA